MDSKITIVIIKINNNFRTKIDKHTKVYIHVHCPNYNNNLCQIIVNFD